MNTTVVKTSFFVSAALAIGGEVARQRLGWQSGLPLSLASGAFCLVFGRMLVVHSLLQQRSIKLGSETIPPTNDVASIFVRGEPIAEEKNGPSSERSEERSVPWRAAPSRENSHFKLSIAGAECGTFAPMPRSAASKASPLIACTIRERPRPSSRSVSVYDHSFVLTSSMYKHASLYSLIAPIGPAFLAAHYFLGGNLPIGSRATVEKILFIGFLLTLTALLAGLFSLLGLRTEPKRAILIRAIPGILLAVPAGVVLFLVGIFVG